MKKIIISLVFLSLFLSCGTEKNALKKGEIREDTGLFIISESTEGYCFLGVNKRKSKVARDYFGLVIDQRVKISLDQISEPVSNLHKIKILEDNGEMQYVWVKLTFHAKEDMEGVSSKNRRGSDLYRYKRVLYFFGGIEMDSIQILDKAKEKIYKQTMDSIVDYVW